MKKAYLLLIPAFTFLSQSISAQTRVDKHYSLQGVEIKGELIDGLSGGDVKRLQVDQNLSAISTTASDIFRQLPAVNSDIEGGVLFRGSANPGFLINGVPYGIMEENRGDFLIQLPAIFFNRIAATSMPRIEFIPEGDAGIINLSSSNYSSSDSPLTITLGAGLDRRYNGGAILNLNPGKFHIVGKYNYRQEYRKRTFTKTTTNKGGTTVMKNNADANPDIHLADLSIGYDLSAHDVVSGYGLFYQMDYSRYGKIRNNKLVDGELVPVMYRNRYNNQNQKAWASEARWIHTFSNPEDQLNLVFNYNNFDYDEDNDYKNEKPETGNIIAEDNYYVNQEKHNYFASALLKKVVFDDWRLRVGYNGLFKNENYDARAAKLNGQEWTPDLKKENNYNFDRRTQQLFMSMARRWNSLSVEAGAQAELSWQKIESKSLDNSDEASHTRFHVYPRVSLNLDLNRAGGLALNYIERVVRPYGNDLNPFVDYSDATHIKMGNPSLKDEHIHSLEVVYSYSLSGFSVSPVVYYRNKKNRIMEHATTIANETVWQKINVGRTNTYGFELSASWTPLQILTLGFAGNIYRDQIDGRTIGYADSKKMTCADLKGNININITPTTELQLDAYYISDQLTSQGKILHRSSVNAGVAQYFFKNKLCANLSINNIFNGLKETTIVNTDNLKITQTRNRDAQVAWLSLTYKL